MKTLAPGETCAYLLPGDATARGCRKPRSCASCLEISGCQVNAIGKCMSVRDEAIDPNSEYRRAVERGLVVENATMAQRPRMRAPQSWQFPAGSVKYCAASDATCSACVRNNFWRSNSSAPDSRFCLGSDGACVCVDVCERSWYIGDDCTEGSGSTAHSVASDEIAGTLWRGIVGLVAVTFILLLLFLRRKCSTDELERVRRLEARQARRTMRARALGVNSLTLTGWESYRRDLIDKEKAQQTQGESRTESESSSSSESSRDIPLPHVANEDATSTVYVAIHENAERNPNGMSTVLPAIETTGASSNAPLAAYNEATPGRQLLAPLTARATMTTV